LYLPVGDLRRRPAATLRLALPRNRRRDCISGDRVGFPSAGRRSSDDRLDLAAEVSFELLAFYVVFRVFLAAIRHVVAARALALHVTAMAATRAVTVRALLLLLSMLFLLSA
jgi:hypothetical protein